MNTENFLAAMSQDLTISQLEGCQIVDFMNNCMDDTITVRYTDTLTVICNNIEYLISNHNDLRIDSNFGICRNYSMMFSKKNKYGIEKNSDFYSINDYLSMAIGCHTGYPIPSCSGGLWQGDNLKNRILYMQWVIRQLKTLKSHLGVE